MTFHPTNNPVFWKQTAEELLAAARFEKALAAYHQLCELTPNDPDAWRGMAQALAGLERHGDAVAAFERALILLPDDRAVLAGLADCYEALGAFEKMTACRIRLGELD
ncbi:tetratricopeptide repeat protein [Methanocorpusculum vombati]|uniref:Tetratricopeptide repeat protein n=1 Tax=Methanocorpusculum vombati TaxID=3002864 RepID=A0ABT4IMY4_9EURY|nr:tetratricopeptide repeat protein [Methanocorpusculum vombati]MCZ9319654.1 tetratricopeptide repeat protein [Methanocorpusculum sp.]MCZ0862921.1 tetratricopeptide repeat protein [Methanocorpusculum vombati]MDE2520898.1 tetratricopeptide repeat protein [Methanocorpusculum sp.]MDE2533659.1 tetratricopeptide repeat protein [Methanocorpusculum sp.]MDE2546003.1 tetratricopeptide repeat protein [Methanocorpusculum sp.]